MAIPFRCQCGKTIKAKDEMAGKKFRCPDCGKAMQVPEPEAFEEDPFETREDDFEEERRPAPRRRSSSGSKPRKAPAKSSNHGLIFGLAAAALAFALVIGGAVFVVARQPKQQPVANNPPIQMPPQIPSIDPNVGRFPDAAGMSQPTLPEAANPPLGSPAVPSIPGDQMWVVLSNFKKKAGGSDPLGTGYTVDYRIAKGAPDPTKQYVLYVRSPAPGGVIERYVEVEVALKASGTIGFSSSPAMGFGGGSLNASIAFRKGFQERVKVSGEITPDGAESLAQAPPTVQQIAGAAAQGKLFALANGKSGRGRGLSPDITVDYVLRGTPEPGRFYYLVAKLASGGDGGVEFDVSHSVRTAKQGETATLGGRVLGSGSGISGAMILHIEKRTSPLPSRFRQQQQDVPEVVSNTVTTQ